MGMVVPRRKNPAATKLSILAGATDLIPRHRVIGHRIQPGERILCVPEAENRQRVLGRFEDLGRRAQKVEANLRDLGFQNLKNILNREGNVAETIAVQIVTMVCAPVVSTLLIRPMGLPVADIEEKLPRDC